MIGESIKNRRKELGLTQEQLVGKAYKEFEKEICDEDIKIFNQAQLSKWESGEQIPNTKNLLRLSQILDISFFDLITVKEDDGIVQKFYDTGYDLGKNIETDLKPKILKLLDYIKNKKMKALIQNFLELFAYNNMFIPEDIAIMIPIYQMNKEKEIGEDRFISYIQSFIMGLHNGNLKKQKIRIKYHKC